MKQRLSDPVVNDLHDQINYALRHLPTYFTHVCYAWLAESGAYCTQTIARLAPPEAYAIPEYALATPCSYSYSEDRWIMVGRVPTEDQLLDARWKYLAKEKE